MEHVCIPDIKQMGAALEVLEIDMYSFKPGYQYDTHYYKKDVEIVYVLQGRGYVTVDGRSIRMRRNECLVIFPGTVHDFYLKRNESCQMIDMVFCLPDSISSVNPLEVKGLRFLEELQDSRYKYFRFLDNNALGDTLHSLYRNKRTPSKYRDELICLDFYSLLFKLSEVMEKTLAGGMMLQNGYLNSACEFILNQYNTEIKLKDVVKAAGISARQLSRLFSDELGMTVQEYIHFLKVSKARELLESTHMGITEIAYALGFNTSDYFATFFKRFEGISPKAYRNMVRNRADISAPALNLTDPSAGADRDGLCTPAGLSRHQQLYLSSLSSIEKD